MVSEATWVTSPIEVWMFFDRRRNLRLALDTSQAIAGSTTSRVKVRRQFIHSR